MSSIPSNLARVPVMLASRLSLSNLNRTNVSLLNVQQQIATGRDIQRVSDDVIRSATISTLDDRLERSSQLRRNLSHAAASLGVLDSALGEASNLALEAKTLASSMINPTSSAGERSGQAVVVDSMIQSLLNTVNRQSVAGYVFGGSVTSRAPVEQLLGGFLYRGQGSGLTTDLGLASSVPITMGAGNPIVSTSGRVRGTADLGPTLTDDTRLADLRGGRGLGVSLGEVRFSAGGGPLATIDLSGADTVADLTDRLTRAIRQYETDNGVTVLGTGAVSIAGGSLNFDVAAGQTLEFFDVGTGITGQDLGLVASPATTFTSSSPASANLDPVLTWRTPISAIASLSGSMGSIKLTNAGRSVDVDLSNAQTLGDVRNAIEGAGLGLRVLINEAGSGIDVLNDLAAGSSKSMSICDMRDGTRTATLLGIRSLAASTRISDFNFGAGVRVVDGQINPTTNTIDPALNTDIRIGLGDPGQTKLDLDLRPQDMGSVQDVLNRLNSQIQSQLSAAGLPSTGLVAELNDDANGIVLRQDSTYTGQITVTPLNNSPAAEQLGLKGGTYDAAGARLIGEDRATVRVDGLFTYLIDLRDSLRTNNTAGIALAGSDIDAAIGSLAEFRGTVGGFAQRVESENVRETDRATLDETTRSELRDTDYASAASRLALLQVQLQAGLQVAAVSRNMSLLDFLR